MDRNRFFDLQQQLSGDLFDDRVYRAMYSTDASAYQELPLGVAIPKNIRDIELVLKYARENTISIIPRGAGTSLAGQVVGSGLIVDISKYFNRILEVNVDDKWVIVEPGVVLDELNLMLKKHSLFFGPETSTSNRCTIGGMVGNNSCGSHSLAYGSTRDHLLEVHGYLISGEKVVFKAISNDELKQKCELSTHEGDIYRKMVVLLNDEINTKSISENYPNSQIHRRNTGYALDELLKCSPFSVAGKPFNLSKLIAGSEGTLFFITAIKLALVSTPPKFTKLICSHFDQFNQVYKANLEILNFHPTAVELMDHNVIILAQKGGYQTDNLFFLEGKPQGLLISEFSSNSQELLDVSINKVISRLTEKKLGYAHVIINQSDIKKVWDLRKAGLGVLANMPGDELPVSLIEDTALCVEDLASFNDDLNKLLKKHNKTCVFHGHIGSGELHLRPILNMKLEEDVKLFRLIATETAHLVKKYHGSLSGEHGDGRLRAEFIPIMLGDHVYGLLKDVKQLFDPNILLNPGKIVDAPPMDTALRYKRNKKEKITPVFNWDRQGGFAQGAEKCTGSADCRKSSLIGGTMCPSFMASKNEKDSTRGRANILRHYLMDDFDQTPVNTADVNSVLDLCLMCKACRSECPSGVDVARLKAEFLQNQHHHKFNLSSWLIAHQPYFYQLLSDKWRGLRKLYSTKLSTKIIRYLLKFDPSIPLADPVEESFFRQIKKSYKSTNIQSNQSVRIWLYIDEFTNYIDPQSGLDTLYLLEKLGFHVEILKPIISGRTFISKGYLKKAKSLAIKNICYLLKSTATNAYIVGVEPSALLTFRDEYPDLISGDLKLNYQKKLPFILTIEEFIHLHLKNGSINTDRFSKNRLSVKLHSHCHQKALVKKGLVQEVLQISENYNVIEISSGCCGMAGAFGYEKSHSALAKQIGELVLFPEVLESPESTVIVAPGVSCRHHIFNNTGKFAYHPASVLLKSMLDV